MTKKENLENKIRNNPKNVSLDDFEYLVNEYGHIKPGSKHAKAIIGRNTMTYKRVNPMPVAYVTDMIKLIDNL